MLADCPTDWPVIQTQTISSLCTCRMDRWIKELLCFRGWLHVCLNERSTLTDGVILGIGEEIIVYLIQRGKMV